MWKKELEKPNSQFYLKYAKILGVSTFKAFK